MDSPLSCLACQGERLIRLRIHIYMGHLSLQTSCDIAQALAEVQLGEGHHAQWPGAGERLSLTCAAVVTDDVNKVFHYRKSIIWANRIVPEFMGDSGKLSREI